MLAEARDVAVADAFGDAGDGELGRAEEFGGFFEAESLQVGLEAEAVLLSEEAGEIAGAGEGDFAGDFGELQRAMQAEGEMRSGALEWIAFGFGGGLGLLGEAEPHGLDVTACSVFGCGGIAESDGFDEVLVFLGQDAGIGKVVVEALLVKSEEAVPDGAPRVLEHGNVREADDGFVQFEVRETEGAVVAGTHGFGDPFQDGSQLFEAFGRRGGLRGRMTGGEAFQHGAEFGESAQFGGGHGFNMRNRASVYAAEVKGSRRWLCELKTQARARFIIQTASTYAKSTTSPQAPMIMPDKVPFGVIAPMTTPFSSSGELMPKSIRSQVDFLVRERADSLAVGGSTGEGQTLDADELRACVSEVRDAMPADMPLVASTICDSTRQAIRSIRAVAGLGVDAIQLTPVHYLFRPDDEMMIEHFRVIHEETGMPLIIYNVVHWCYLSPELTVRLMNEVPGVMGIKQSAGDLKLFADLMINAPKDRKIYSAVDALMYPSFCLGTPGVIAATPSGIPRATALLRDAVAKGDHANARLLHEAILRFWNATDHYNLPACIRYAQSLQGVDAGFPRMPMRPATEEQQAKIKPALEAVLKLADELS